MNLIKIFSLFLFTVFFFEGELRAHAARSYGRLTTGGYVATEKFASEDFGSDSNDEMVFSSRLFNKVTDVGNSWNFTSDLRDKHDFFDKLDKERLELRDKNEFQVRQLNTQWISPSNRVALSLGRFPVQDVGAIYTDGLLAEYRWNPRIWSSLFGGKNPQAESHSALKYNPDANIAGLGLTYQSKASDWTRNFYLTHGVITETFGPETDRSFLYHQMNYQWEEGSRVLTLMYVDFVPRSYLQNGSLIWQQEYSDIFSSELIALSMDSIEYYRRQGIRETLPASPYQEAQAKFTLGPPRGTRWTLAGLAGERHLDQKSKTEVTLGVSKSRIFTPNWDFYTKLGGRKNFASQDLYIRTGLDYFSRKWEFNLDLEYATEKLEDGTTLHPLIAEFSASNSITRTLFWTASVQRAADENVTILTSFFKIGYRFGSTETAPQRSSAPIGGAI